MSWDDPRLHSLAAEFFRTFSRMEYALKAAGHFVKNQRKAEPDWPGFAATVEAAFAACDSRAVKEAADFILREPPRKQINVNNRIEWDSTPPQAADQIDLLLAYVRRVRNNLFHGGKFNGHWFQPERSGDLIQASLVLLNWCREANTDVDRAYHS